MNQDLGSLWVILNAAVYFITFLFSLFFRNLLVSFIILLYSISAFSSTMLYIFYNDNSWNITLLPFIYLYITLIILIIPLIKFNPEKMRFHPEVLKNPIIYIVSFLAIVSILNGLNNIDISTISTLEKYKEGHLNQIDDIEGFSNWLTWPITISSNLSLYFIFFVFYLLCCKEKKYNSLLCITFLYIFIFKNLLTLAISTRSGIVYGIILFISSYLIFRKKFKMTIFLRIHIYIFIFLSFMLFMKLTIDRFSEDRSMQKKSDNPVEYSLLGYSGQGFLNFNDSIFYETKYSYGDVSASVFRLICGLEASRGLKMYNHKWQAERDRYSSMGVFNTYAGALCLDYGPYITFLIVILISFLFFLILNRNIYNIDSIFAIFIYVSSISFGVITYPFRYLPGTALFVLLILFYFYLKITVFRYKKN